MPRPPSLLTRDVRGRYPEEEFVDPEADDFEVQGPPNPADIPAQLSFRLQQAELGARRQPRGRPTGDDSEVIQRLRELVSIRPDFAAQDPRSWTTGELEKAIGGDTRTGEEPILDITDSNARAMLSPEQLAYVEARVRESRAPRELSEPGVIDRLAASIGGRGERSEMVADAGGSRRGFIRTGGIQGGVGIAEGAPQVGKQGKPVARTKSALPQAPEGGGRGPHTEFERQLVEGMQGKTLDLSGAAQQVKSKKEAAARAALGGGEAASEQGPPMPAGVRRAEAERFGRQADAAMIMGNPALAAAYESSQGTYRKVPRKDYPREQRLVKELGGTMQRNPLTGEAEYMPGTIDRRAGAQEEILQQEAAEAEIYAGEMRRREVELRAADQARIEADQRRIDRYSEEVNAIQRQTEGLTRASDMMEKTPDLGTWWQDRTTGQKVGAVLGMILGRMVGLNPMDILNSAVANEQQRAKFNWQKRKDLVDARGAEQRGLINAYSVLSEYAGSEQELDKLVQLSMYENAQRRLERMAAEGKVRVMPGQLELGRSMIQEEAAKRRYELQGLAARSVPNKSVFSPKWPGPVRKALKAEGAAESDFGRAVRLKGAEAQIKAAAEASEPMAPEQRRIIATAARDTEAAYAAIQTIDDMLKLAPTGAAPGKFGTWTVQDVVSKVMTGPPDWAGLDKPLGSLLTSDEKKAWDRYKSKMLLSTQKWLTGAAVAEDQKPYFEALIAAVDNASTSEDEVKAVQDLRNMLYNHAQAIEYGLSEEDRQDLHRNPNLAPLPARNVGPGDSSTLPSGWGIPYK